MGNNHASHRLRLDKTAGESVRRDKNSSEVDTINWSKFERAARVTADRVGRELAVPALLAVLMKRPLPDQMRSDPTTWVSGYQILQMLNIALREEGRLSCK